jgi:hypothetical protein
MAFSSSLRSSFCFFLGCADEIIIFFPVKKKQKKRSLLGLKQYILFFFLYLTPLSHYNPAKTSFPV